MTAPTVCLVLGAGASKPYGYPLGWQLKERIIQYCLSKPPDCAPPEKRAETWDKLEQFGRRFDQDETATIDAFLSTLPTDDELGRHGRMAIVAVLRTYEHCYEEKKEWYEKILEFLESKPNSNSLKVVTFNHDRSFEFFLSRSIERHHNIPTQDARKKFQQLVEIEHVYGCFADLPGFSTNPATCVEYAQLTGHDGWKGGLESIELIGEAIPSSPRVSRSKEWIQKSDYILVLGFGFDYTNLNLIGLDNLSSEKFLFCTGFKLTAETRSRVRWSCAPAKVHFAREDTDIGRFLDGSRVLSSVMHREQVERAYARLGPGVP